MKSRVWTRRQFSQAAVLLAASPLLPRLARASSVTNLEGLAFVGCASAGGTPGAVHVYSVSAAGWRRTQSLPAAAPAHLLLHPSLPVLYALHDVAEWDSLPRGAVSAYTIDSGRGQLRPSGTQPLSLAATHPRHGALAGDGRHLLVAAERGGMYNLLPLTEEGELQPVTSIRKEFGLGDGDSAKVAAPGSVALHPDGNLFSVDPGQESLTSFQLCGSEFTVQERMRVHPGYGATQLVIAPCGRRAYTLGHLGRVVAAHKIGGQASHQLSAVSLEESQAQSIAIAPGGRFLLASGAQSTVVFRIDAETGLLSRHASLRGMGQRMSFAANSGHLLGLDTANGAVLQMAFDTVDGTAGTPETVAELQNIVSMAFLPAGVASPQVGAL